MPLSAERRGDPPREAASLAARWTQGCYVVEWAEKEWESGVADWVVDGDGSFQVESMGRAKDQDVGLRVSARPDRDKEGGMSLALFCLINPTKRRSTI